MIVTPPSPALYLDEILGINDALGDMMGALGSGSLIGTGLAVAATIVSVAGYFQEQQRSNNELIVALVGATDAETANNMLWAHELRIIDLDPAAVDKFETTLAQDTQNQIDADIANIAVEDANPRARDITDGAGREQVVAPEFAAEFQRRAPNTLAAPSNGDTPTAAYDTDPNEEARALTSLMDSSVRATRLNATQRLINSVNEGETLDAVFDRLEGDNLDALSATGRYNALFVLNRRSEWSRAEAARLTEVLDRIEARSADGVAVGRQTQDLIDALRSKASGAGN